MRDNMSFEMSLQIKILALVGLVLAAGAAGTLVLSQSRSPSQPVVVPVKHVAQTHPATQRPVAAKPVAHPASRVDLSVPAPLRHALARSPIVVAVVYAPGDAADAEVVAQARAGAHSAGVGFVALNVRDDRIATSTAAWMHNIVEPAVVVVKRPGTIAVELDGYSDSTMVAQAVADSRR
jgi:hypothetical protein